MSPAALHKNPTQTVDSSQVFERWILQKQPGMINKKNKKLGQKHNQRSRTGFSQTVPRFSLLTVFVKKIFT